MAISAPLVLAGARTTVAAPTRPWVGKCPMESVGERVRRYRRLRRLTQASLAEQAGLDQRYLGRIETGDVLEPGVEAVRKLAAALAVPIREIANPAWYEDDAADWEPALRAEMARKGYGPEDTEAVVRAVRLTLEARERASA